MNPLLARQIRKHLPQVDPGDPAWARFFAAVDAGYNDLQNDHGFVTRTLEVVSNELGAANEKLRRDSEHQLESLSRYYQQTLELQQGMILCLRREPQGFVHTLCRGELAHRLLLTPAGVEGQTVEEVVPPENAPQLTSAYARAWAGEAHSFTYSDARTGIEVLAMLRPRSEQGVVREVIASCIEITALKQAERELRSAKDRAEAADRAKSEFLAVMSHELRTPLAGVIGTLDLLRRSPPETQRRQYTEVARDCAGALLRLLDDILDMAKIESGKFSLEAIPFRLRQEFRHLCEAARLRADSRNLDFQYRVHPDVPPVLVGDPTRLRQILGNLQNNALKFTEHGSVHVDIGARPLDARHVRLVLSVRDTGIGIPESARVRLFSKFEQGDLSTTRRFGGTGLGLSIVKALTAAMQGDITVESQPGRGSTFTFTVPLPIGAEEDAPADDAFAPVSSPRHTCRLRILCAEDDTVNRLVAEALVQPMGHEIVFAENGQLAIERLRRERFDLVLMDGRMPVMDGFQATSAIRSGTAGVLDPDIYICAATANVSEADRRRCREHGMNDYLPKPLLQAELFAALQRAIEHPQRLDRLPHDNGPRGLSVDELLACLDAPAAPPPSRSPFPAETLQRMHELFAHNAPQRIAAARAAFARHDLATIALHSHALKSSARYVGASHLSDLCAELESLAGRGDAGAVDRLLTAVEAELSHLPSLALLPTASPS